MVVLRCRLINRVESTGTLRHRNPQLKRDSINCSKVRLKLACPSTERQALTLRRCAHMVCASRDHDASSPPSTADA